MPYMDRGSWVHVVAFDPKPSTAGPTPVTQPRPADAALPATGPSALPAALGAALLGAAVVARRRRAQSV